MIEQYKKCKELDDVKEIERLQGMLCSARQIESQIFPSVANYLKMNENRVKEFRRMKSAKKRCRKAV